MAKRTVIGGCMVSAAVVALAGLLTPARDAGAVTASALGRQAPMVDGLGGPTGEAVSGTDVWITDRTGDALTEITDTGRLVRRVSGAAYRLERPGPIAASAGTVWVASRSGLTEVGAGTGALIRTVPASALGMRRPVAALVVSDGRLVAVGSGGAVAEVAIGSGSVLRTASPTSTGLVAPEAATVAGPDVWVASTGDDTVVELRTADLHRIRTVSAPADQLGGPDGISFDGARIWVSDRSAYAVTELSTTGRLIQVISNATGDYGFDQPGAMVHWGGYTFVASPPGSSPMITQVADSTGGADWYMCNTNGPYHFADPSSLVVVRGRLWVANPTGNSLTEMDADTGALIATIP